MRYTLAAAYIAAVRAGVRYDAPPGFSINSVRKWVQQVKNGKLSEDDLESKAIRARKPVEVNDLPEDVRTFFEGVRGALIVPSRIYAAALYDLLIC